MFLMYFYQNTAFNLIIPNQLNIMCYILLYKYNIFIFIPNTLGRVGTIGFLLYQSPKFYDSVFLFVGFEYFHRILIGWFIKWIVQTFVIYRRINLVYSFQPLIVIYRRGNFVYYYMVCTLYINLSAVVLSLQSPAYAHLLYYRNNHKLDKKRTINCYKAIVT